VKKEKHKPNYQKQRKTKQEKQDKTKTTVTNLFRPSTATCLLLTSYNDIPLTSSATKSGWGSMSNIDQHV
jgi:hypothetical protein